jgi:hypothetical protein
MLLGFGVCFCCWKFRACCCRTTKPSALHKLVALIPQQPVATASYLRNVTLRSRLQLAGAPTAFRGPCLQLAWRMSIQKFRVLT